jgi:hypothetical protein
MQIEWPSGAAEAIDGQEMSVLRALVYAGRPRDKNLLFRGRREFPLQPLNLPV